MIAAILMGVSFVGVLGMVAWIEYLNYRKFSGYLDKLEKTNEALLKHFGDLLNKKLAPDWYQYVNGKMLLKDAQAKFDFDTMIEPEKKKFPTSIHSEGATDTSINRF